MKTELILADTGRLEIPPPQHEGFAALVQTANRLPDYVPAGADKRQLLAAVFAEANKKSLANCTRQSVCKTAFNCVVLGLVPGDVLGMAHFVPFKDRRRNIEECQLIVGYKGWLDLAYDADFLKDVHSEVVLAGEDFKRWNDEAGVHVRHRLGLDHEENLQWDKVQAAYCIWHSKNGGSGMEIVGRKALEALKRRGNVWNDNPIAMCLKTPIIRSAKTWRRTRKIMLAGALEDALDAEASQPALVDEGILETEKPGLDAFDEHLEPQRIPGPPAMLDAQCAQELAMAKTLTAIVDIASKYRPVLGEGVADRLAAERREQLKGRNE